MKKTVDITLLDTLPDSISGDKNVAASAVAIDPHLRSISLDIPKTLIYARIDSLSSEALDHFAQQFTVEPWRDYWSVELKRSVIKSNIENKRKRGTLASIIKAVESLGSSVYITPWYKLTPPGTPGTFRITATYVGDSSNGKDMEEAIKKAIDVAKPFSRHTEIVMTSATSGGIYLASFVRPVTVVKLLDSRIGRGIELADYWQEIKRIVGTPPEGYEGDMYEHEDVTAVCASITEVIGETA